MNLDLVMEAVKRNLQRQSNGSDAQTGQQRGNAPTGVIPITLDDSQRIDARYWENPIKDSAEIRVGYTKPRIVQRGAKEQRYFAFQLRHAMADIEATYRVCERALERHTTRELVLCEDDRREAERVVWALGSYFRNPEDVQPQNLAFDPDQLSRLLTGRG